MTLHHRSYGAGQPLIILHGLFGSLDNWATLARRWAKQFHVLAVDARNHGRSFHDPVMSYPAMAADLARFMDEHSLPSAHLLGHSMGGKTAMYFALAHERRVNRLIVIDISPRQYPRRHDEILEALLSLRPEMYASRTDAEHALAARLSDPATRRFLLKNLARNSPAGYRWKMNLPSIAAHYDEIRSGVPEGERCEAPALFVRGGRSRYVPDEDRDLIQTIFPRSAVLTIRDAGHWVHVDAPDELDRVVMQFLAGDNGRRAGF